MLGPAAAMAMATTSAGVGRTRERRRGWCMVVPPGSRSNLGMTWLGLVGGTGRNARRALPPGRQMIPDDRGADRRCLRPRCIARRSRNRGPTLHDQGRQVEHLKTLAVRGPGFGGFGGFVV